MAALFPLALLENITGLIGGFGLLDWAGIAFLGFFGTVLGFFWYYEGIKAIGPSRASVFINFVPVSGVFFGWLILGESINLSLLGGAALIIAGVYLTNRPAKPSLDPCDPQDGTKNPIRRIRLDT